MEGARSVKKEKKSSKTISDENDISEVNYHNIGNEIKIRKHMVTVFTNLIFSFISFNTKVSFTFWFFVIIK